MMCFVEASIDAHHKKGNWVVIAELCQSKARLMHWFSLLAALACQRMQADDDAEEEEPEEHQSKHFPQLKMRPEIFNLGDQIARMRLLAAGTDPTELFNSEEGEIQKEVHRAANSVAEE